MFRVLTRLSLEPKPELYVKNEEKKIHEWERERERERSYILVCEWSPGGVGGGGGIKRICIYIYIKWIVKRHDALIN
jgi:hypothetical protein